MRNLILMIRLLKYSGSGLKRYKPHNLLKGRIMTNNNHLYRMYSKIRNNLEYCFNIQSSRVLTNDEVDFLVHLLAAGHDTRSIKLASELNGDNVVEIGPRMAPTLPT